MTKSSNSKNNLDNLQEFQVALNHAEFASEQLWSIFQIFILANTILIGLLGNILFPDNGQFNAKNIIYLRVVLGIGLAMSIMWLGAYLRTRGYYDFRLAQAAKEERKTNLNILKEGKKFAEGESVRLNEDDEKPYQMHCLAQLLRMTRTMPVFISFFIFFYLYLLFNAFGLL